MVDGHFCLNTLYILKYCNVQMIAQLPVVWEEVAREDSAQVPTVLQQVMEVASHQVTGHQCEFQVTTTLATKILSLNWAPLDLDNLSNRLIPFLLAP